MIAIINDIEVSPRTEFWCESCHTNCFGRLYRVYYADDECEAELCRFCLRKLRDRITTILDDYGKTENISRRDAIRAGSSENASRKSEDEGGDE